MPTVLVTGANRGLGLEFVKQYSRANWEVIATCRDPGSASEVSALAESASSIELYPLEVTDAEGVLNLAATLSGRSIDLLLLNAGVMGASSTTLGELDQANFLHSMNVNTVAPALNGAVSVGEMWHFTQKVSTLVPRLR